LHIDDDFDKIHETPGQAPKRPDYLSIYIGGGKCIWTIIEIKKKTTDDGVAQINTLCGMLQEQFTNCLPHQLRPHIQGLVVTQLNAQQPKQRNSTPVIRHVQINNGDDIHSFISTELSQGGPLRPDKAAGKDRPFPRDASKAEKMLRTCVRKKPCAASDTIRSNRKDGLAVAYDIDGEQVFICADAFGEGVLVHANAESALGEELARLIGQAGINSK
jgi:hypothetical protein